MLKRWFGRAQQPETEDVRQPDTEAPQPGAPLTEQPVIEQPPVGGEQIEKGLARTRMGLLGRLSAVFGPTDITDETWQELEEQLILSDVGVAAATELVAATRQEARARGVRSAEDLPLVLHDVIVDTLSEAEDVDDGTDEADDEGPWVVLVVGVNGSGKTTTIAKLASRYASSGDSVLLVAADTFRAAAVEQLQMWGSRVGVPVVAGQQGGDPGAVVYDALQSSAGRAADVIIVDTAGRLHTQHNLMAELKKVRGVAGRVIPGAPHETVLVLDATTGQNGLAQARAFSEAVDVTGLVLAKLDSSARGGVALAVTRELGLPIWFVGTGEQMDDLTPFNAAAYADGLLGRTNRDGQAA